MIANSHSCRINLGCTLSSFSVKNRLYLSFPGEDVRAVAPNFNLPHLLINGRNSFSVPDEATKEEKIGKFE